MQPWLHAWILGTISGLSLPIGAILGIVFTPVRDEVCAAWMALGAGALLFAVTVELYGHALRELELGRAGILELLTTVAGALVGALFYLAVNRWLEQMMEESLDNGKSQQGSVASTSPLRDRLVTANEHTPQYQPYPGEDRRLSSKDGMLSVIGALAEERRGWEQQVTSPSGTNGLCPLRDESFSRLSSFGATDDGHSIRSRGRDRVINRMSSRTSKSRSPGSPSESLQSLAQVDPEMAQRGKQVAFALFLGILVDGVPEGLLMGFLAAEGHLSVVLVISLLVANFPEAFSSASLMRQGNVPTVRIVSMWGGLCVMVGSLAGSACFVLKYFFPTYPEGRNLPQMLLFTVALIEGITGGAMIACIATVMLPEAFHRAGKEGMLIASSGFLCTAGFLLAVTMKALEHAYNNHHEPDLVGHTFYNLRASAW